LHPSNLLDAAGVHLILALLALSPSSLRKVGSTHPVLSLPFAKWNLLATPCWLKSLWQFCDYAHITLCPINPIVPPPPLEHDGGFMDSVLQTALPLATILAINRCRIAHQVLYWSDIANSWGDVVSPCMLLPAAGPSHSPWLWPPEKPSRQDWLLWRQFLHFLPCTYADQFLQPLGHWISQPLCTNFIPFDVNSTLAFQPGHAQYWRCFSSASTRPYRSCQTFRLSSITACPPTYSHYACIDKAHGSVIVLSGLAPFLPLPSLVHIPWPLRHANLPANGQCIALALAQGTAIGICDGLYMPTHYPLLAAAAWILAESSGSALSACSGVTQVHSTPDTLNSY